jgi:hypothetical protein
LARFRKPEFKVLISLELELRVKQDLSGIGPMQSGVLPAGLFKAPGPYSGLIDAMGSYPYY